MRDRRFREEDRRHGERRDDQFDPRTEGARYGLSPEVSLEIWEAVCRASQDAFVEEDARVARFLALVARAARRGGRFPCAPGKRTLLDVDGWHEGSFGSVPGRITRVDAEGEARHGEREAAPTAAVRGEERAPTPPLALLAASHASPVPAVAYRVAAGAAPTIKRADLVALLAGSVGTPPWRREPATTTCSREAESAVLASARKLMGPRARERLPWRR